MARRSAATAVASGDNVSPLLPQPLFATGPHFTAPLPLLTCRHPSTVSLPWAANLRGSLPTSLSLPPSNRRSSGDYMLQFVHCPSLPTASPALSLAAPGGARGAGGRK